MSARRSRTRAVKEDSEDEIPTFRNTASNEEPSTPRSTRRGSHLTSTTPTASIRVTRSMSNTQTSVIKATESDQNLDATPTRSKSRSTRTKKAEDNGGSILPLKAISEESDTATPRKSRGKKEVENIEQEVQDAAEVFLTNKSSEEWGASSTPKKSRGRKTTETFDQPPHSPSRITRAMRKAGVSTPESSEMVKVFDEEQKKLTDERISMERDELTPKKDATPLTSPFGKSPEREKSSTPSVGYIDLSDDEATPVKQIKSAENANSQESLVTPSKGKKGWLFEPANPCDDTVVSMDWDADSTFRDVITNNEDIVVIDDEVNTPRKSADKVPRTSTNSAVRSSKKKLQKSLVATVDEANVDKMVNMIKQFTGELASSEDTGSESAAKSSEAVNRKESENADVLNSFEIVKTLSSSSDSIVVESTNDPSKIESMETSISQKVEESVTPVPANSSPVKNLAVEFSEKRTKKRKSSTTFETSSEREVPTLTSSTDDDLPVKEDCESLFSLTELGSENNMSKESENLGFLNKADNVLDDITEAREVVVVLEKEEKCFAQNLDKSVFSGNSNEPPEKSTGDLEVENLLDGAETKQRKSDVFDKSEGSQVNESLIEIEEQVEKEYNEEASEKKKNKRRKSEGKQNTSAQQLQFEAESESKKELPEKELKSLLKDEAKAVDDENLERVLSEEQEKLEKKEAKSEKKKNKRESAVNDDELVVELTEEEKEFFAIMKKEYAAQFADDEDPFVERDTDDEIDYQAGYVYQQDDIVDEEMDSENEVETGDLKDVDQINQNEAKLVIAESPKEKIEAVSQNDVEQVIEKKSKKKRKAERDDTEKATKGEKQKTEKTIDHSELVPVEVDVEKKKSKKQRKKTSAKVSPEAQEVIDAPSSTDDVISFPKFSSFDDFFNKRAKNVGKLDKSISSLYVWATSIDPQANDLPLPFISNNDEVVWSYIKHQNKQVNNVAKKNKDLLQELVGKNILSAFADDEKEEEEEEVEESVQDEDEEVYDENISEDDNDEEEENVDLFNLNEEDLKNLEQELEEMENEGSDGEENNEEQAEPEKKKKFPKSAVDDKFFSLAEMNEFLDAQDRGAPQENLLLEEDKWEGATNYKYEDFFGNLQEADDVSNKKSKKRKHDDEPVQEKKKKKVRFSMPEDEEDVKSNEDVEDEEMMDEDYEKDENRPVLMGAVDDDDKPQSNFEKRQKKLREKISELEEENLKPRSWELSGEIAADQREENTLLEQHVDFDHGAKRAPEVTEDFTDRLEELIKQRIRDKAFDDVVRVTKTEQKQKQFRTEALEDTMTNKQSLSEVYEKEYQQKIDGKEKKTEKNEAHEEIKKRQTELFRLLDAMSHFQYSPPEVREEVKIVSNMASLNIEEVGIMASTESQMLAPEEVKKKAKGAMKADEERDKTDKLRARRKKKTKQRALVLRMGEEAVFGEQKAKKLKKKKKADGEQGEGKIKSSNFFSKLQETVQEEKLNKKKKKKVKSETVTAPSSKFKL